MYSSNNKNDTVLFPVICDMTMHNIITLYRWLKEEAERFGCYQKDETLKATTIITLNLLFIIVVIILCYTTFTHRAKALKELERQMTVFCKRNSQAFRNNQSGKIKIRRLTVSNVAQKHSRQIESWTRY